MVDIGVEWWILYGSIGVLAVMVGVASISALNGITEALGKIQEELGLLSKQLLETNKNTKQASTAATALALLFREATTQGERELKNLEAELEQEAHKDEV